MDGESKTIVDVLLAVDARQVVGCAVTMRSTLESASPSAGFRFHVMTDGVSRHDLQRLRASVEAGARDVEVRTYPVDARRFARLMRSKIVTHMTYARLILDEVLPVEVERCIYMDCDMVVERDVLEVWSVDLRGRTLAAVPNSTEAERRDHQSRLGLKEARYFNAGFAVIDVRRWRALAVGARAMAHAVAIGDRLILHDQDALNVALQHDWVELPAHWNAGIFMSPWLTADSPAVFHYMGAPKPWEVDYQGRFHDLFLRHLSRTEFASWRPWNPLGMGAALRRARRRIPFLPAVVRELRRILSGGGRAAG